jgi:alkanesulfonate monooxygenase SsuD/methylene tetrahydromethanopterin reductase-like flavin-dependent oxidoreductase (luciferase family)
MKPHPPMWVAASNPGHSRKAAKMGLGVLSSPSVALRQLRAARRGYKNTIADAEPVGDYVNDNVAVVSQFLCLKGSRGGATG